MKKRTLKKTLKSPFFSKKEKESWKSKLHNTIYFLEILETQFPNWVLPGDFMMVGISGSKMNHLIDFEKRKDALCETGLIESKEYPANYIRGDGVKGTMPAFKYRITKKGLDFLNSVRMKNLNTKIFLVHGCECLYL